MFNLENFTILLIQRKKKLPEIAKILGISLTTLYRKLNGISDFNRNEIMKLMEFLEIHDPTPIFFYKESNENATAKKGDNE